LIKIVSYLAKFNVFTFLKHFLTVFSEPLRNPAELGNGWQIDMEGKFA